MDLYLWTDGVFKKEIVCENCRDQKILRYYYDIVLKYFTTLALEWHACGLWSFCRRAMCCYRSPLIDWPAVNIAGAYLQAGRHSIRRGLPICPALAPSPCPSVGLGTSTRASREPSSTIKSSCPAAHAPCTPDTSHARRVQLLSCSGQGRPPRFVRGIVVASCARPSTSREEWQGRPTHPCGCPVSSVHVASRNRHSPRPPRARPPPSDPSGFCPLLWLLCSFPSEYGNLLRFSGPFFFLKNNSSISSKLITILSKLISIL